jgi:alpha-glucosidase
MLLLTLRGTPTLYQGDELGIADVPIPPDRVRDPWELRVPGLGLGRDPARTPMQWDGGPGAGFTTGEPWLPLTDDHRVRNVESQRADPDSLLHLYRRLLALRRTEPALSIGAWTEVDAEGDVLAFLRTHGAQRYLVALNLGADAAVLEAAAVPGGAVSGRVALGTRRAREGEAVRGAVRLGGGEGVLVRLG